VAPWSPARATVFISKLLTSPLLRCRSCLSLSLSLQRWAAERLCFQHYPSPHACDADAAQAVLAAAAAAATAAAEAEAEATTTASAAAAAAAAASGPGGGGRFLAAVVASVPVALEVDRPDGPAAEAVAFEGQVSAWALVHGAPHEVHLFSTSPEGLSCVGWWRIGSELEAELYLPTHSLLWYNRTDPPSSFLLPSCPQTASHTSPAPPFFQPPRPQTNELLALLAAALAAALELALELALAAHARTRAQDPMRVAAAFCGRHGCPGADRVSTVAAIGQELASRMPPPPLSPLPSSPLEPQPQKQRHLSGRDGNGNAGGGSYDSDSSSAEGGIGGGGGSSSVGDEKTDDGRDAGNAGFPRVVVSLSTLPARLSSVGPWLAALLSAQALRPDKAYVALPFWSLRQRQARKQSKRTKQMQKQKQNQSNTHIGVLSVRSASQA